MFEWYSHENERPFRSYFLTITYRGSELPTASDGVTPTLDKRAILKWLENTAKALGAFRYYIVGEYGEDGGRPHYHLALFCESSRQAWAITERAKKHMGRAELASMSPRRARYLAKYSTKKLTSGSDPRLKASQEPEFRSSSKRPPLGSEFALQLAQMYRTAKGQKWLRERGDIETSVKLDGQSWPLDNWMKTKVRKELGIPLKHGDRLCNDKYEENYLRKDSFAEFNLELRDRQERHLSTRQFQRRMRNGTRTL